MAKVRTVQKFKSAAVNEAAKMPHEDYKRIKHMPKVELVNYIRSVYGSGYKAGFDAGVKSVTPADEKKYKVTKIDPPAEQEAGNADN